MADLLALAERVEAATGPDRQLDNVIRLATNNGCAFDDDPAYTSSLDAAMTLVDGFVLTHLSDVGADGLPLATLGDPRTTPAGQWYGISSASGCSGTVKLALALTAACLRARAAQSPLPSIRTEANEKG